MEEIRICQCRLGELCQLATASRPDIYALLARLAARVNSLLGGNVYRKNDLAKTEKKCQRATVSKYASMPRPFTPARGEVDGRMGARSGEVQHGTMTLAGWPNAAYRGETS